MSWPFSELPILQAPTGSIAGPELCAAVTEAGGLGAMGLTWTEPETVRRHVRDVVDSLRKHSFQVNFVLHFESKGLTAALEEGAPIVTFSWGMPGKELELARSFGARIGIQVGTAEGARRAIGLGADFLICQGVEAGGHVQSSIPLERLLERVLPVAPTTPVVAAGGLVDAQDVARVLHLGASAAMLGTRFVATQESRAHPRYKQLLVESSETALTICFDGGWPFAQHRVLRNQALEEWEAAGCPPPGRRPGEGEAVAKGIARYEDTAPRVGMAGDFDRMCLYAGAGVGKIRDIPAAPEVVAGLVNGAS